MMQQNSLIGLMIHKIYRHKILILLTSMCLIAILAASQYSFIQINTSSGTNNINFTIQNENTQVAGTFRGNVRKLVKRGVYRVTTSGRDGSYFSVANARGFFQTTHVNSKHQQEEARQYIGDKPSQCLYSENGDNLISWQCGGSISSANFHVGPSNNSPGYSLPLAVDANEISLLGFVIDSGQLKAFVSHKDEHGTEFGLYPVNTSTHTVALNAFKKVEGLDPDKEYGISPYKNGYLVYGTLGDEFLYYQNLSTPPQQLNIQPTKLSGINFYGISTADDSITILNNQHYNPEYLGYSFLNPSTSVISNKYFEEEDEGSSPDDSPLNFSEVVIYSNNNERRYRLDFAASQARLCGRNKLCVLSDETLYLYTINQNELEQTGTIPNVRQMEVYNRGILAVTDSGLLTINPETMTGYYRYSFRDYTFCGIRQINSDKTLLCIEKNNRSSVLAISSGRSDGIDTHISRLMDSPEVRAVSIHKNNILVVPDVTRTVFNKSLASYAYDPKEIAEKKAIIESQIRNSGLDTKKYKVVYSIN